uniref:DUF4283 domain-containing protein n=1 Tax=Cannabis sativa TaxID=3483 RepID=A0A803PAS3_CANSA
MAKKKRVVRKPAITLNLTDPPSIQDNLIEQEDEPTESNLVEMALQMEDIIQSDLKPGSKTEKQNEGQGSWADEVEKDDSYTNSQQKWKQFTEWANPPFSVFEGFLKQKWGKLSIQQIVRMNGGFTIVKFNDTVTRNLVLEEALSLVKSVPLWIRLYDLGLQYWGTKCLSALVSTLGKPIMTDKVTKERSMVKFARVLVEMDISDEHPRRIEFLNEHGQLIELPVEYEWLPVQCKNCRSYGHLMANCRRKKESNEGNKVVSKQVQKEWGASKINDAEMVVVTEQKQGKDSTQPLQAEKVTDNGGSKGEWKTPKRKVQSKRIVEQKIEVADEKESNSFIVLQGQNGGEKKEINPDEIANG